jgi:hypothetical protein
MIEMEWMWRREDLEADRIATRAAFNSPAQHTQSSPEDTWPQGRCCRRVNFKRILIFKLFCLQLLRLIVLFHVKLKEVRKCFKRYEDVQFLIKQMLSLQAASVNNGQPQFIKNLSLL